MFKVNKGIDRPPEVLGIRGINYLLILAGGVVGGLVVTAILIGITGIPPIYGFGTFLVLVFVLYTQLVSYSKKYGERGLSKFQAHQRMPSVIVIRGSKVYKNMLGTPAVKPNSGLKRSTK